MIDGLHRWSSLPDNVAVSSHHGWSLFCFDGTRKVFVSKMSAERGKGRGGGGGGGEDEEEESFTGSWNSLGGGGG